MNFIADYINRYSGVGSCTARELPIDTPNVRNAYVDTQLKVGKNMVLKMSSGTELTPLKRMDPWLGKISIEGENQKMYKKFKEYFKKKPKISLFLVEETSKEILIKEGSDIIIPTNLTKELVDILHETHVSEKGMKRLAHDKFWWPE